MAGEAIRLPLFDETPEEPAGQESTSSLEKALLHAKEHVTNLGFIDIDAPTQRGARDADGSRIQVATRDSQHHAKSQKGEKQMGVFHELSKEEIDNLWFNGD